MKKFLAFLPAFGLLAAMMLPGCEEVLNNNPGNDINEGTGKLIIKLTDAPFPVDMIDSAMITIVKVDIRDEDLAEEDSIYPYITLMEDTSITYNLLELRNGVTAGLIDADIPAGNYDLVRVYVDEASLSVRDGDTYKMKVPSGSQTGIKVYIEPSVHVSGTVITELLLDFSLEQSFVLKGNYKTPAGIKGFNFKPVVRAVNNTTTGMIAGMVADTSEMPVNYAAVWIEQDSVIAITASDSTGYYGLIGVPAGMYNIYATAENHDTVSVMDIEVFAGNLLEQNFVLTPLAAEEVVE